MESNLNYLFADWPAPKNVQALTTKRYPGFSVPPYAANNLALHVGDNAQNVELNRTQLIHNLQLPKQPEWLNQTHSTDCIIVENEQNRNADAAITRIPMRVLAIMTADCVPIVLSNKAGTEIAAIHAGWRGLLNGIIQNCLAKIRSESQDLMAWIGPAMCGNCYETGDEVYKQFQDYYPQANEAFVARGSKWLADLPEIAACILQMQGVKNIFKSNKCTYEDENEFYSYRRAQQTGRIATLIWFT